MIVQIAARHLLILDAGGIGLAVRLSGLLADVHQQQGRPERELGNVIVVPHRLHGLVILCAAVVIGAGIHVVRVLVVGQDGVELVTMPLVTQAQHIVGIGCRSKVIGADDAFVVIGKRHPAGLGKKAMPGTQLHPAFIEVDTLVPFHAPDRRVLKDGMDLQGRALVPDDQEVSPVKKVGHVFRRGGGPGHTAAAGFSVRDGLQPDAQLILQRVGLGADATMHQKGDCGKKDQRKKTSVHGKLYHKLL